MSVPISQLGFLSGSDGEESAFNVGDLGFDPKVWKIAWRMKCNLLQVLAWKIPWTEEPVGLQSIGSQRVGHD